MFFSISLRLSFLVLSFLRAFYARLHRYSPFHRFTDFHPHSPIFTATLRQNVPRKGGLRDLEPWNISLLLVIYPHRVPNSTLHPKKMFFCTAIHPFEQHWETGRQRRHLFYIYTYTRIYIYRSTRRTRPDEQIVNGTIILICHIFSNLYNTPSSLYHETYAAGTRPAIAVRRTYSETVGGRQVQVVVYAYICVCVCTLESTCTTCTHQ